MDTTGAVAAQTAQTDATAMELAEDPQADSSSAEEWRALESPHSSSSTNNELRTLAQVPPYKSMLNI
jgi:hypothetical protein